MWMTILSATEVRVTLAELVKYGLLVTPASLAAYLNTLAVQFPRGM